MAPTRPPPLQSSPLLSRCERCLRRSRSPPNSPGPPAPRSWSPTPETVTPSHPGSPVPSSVTGPLGHGRVHPPERRRRGQQRGAHGDSDKPWAARSSMALPAPVCRRIALTVDDLGLSTRKGGDAPAARGGPGWSRDPEMAAVMLRRRRRHLMPIARRSALCLPGQCPGGYVVFSVPAREPATFPAAPLTPVARLDCPPSHSSWETHPRGRATSRLIPQDCTRRACIAA